jgi:Helicase HerA, central domain
MDLVSKKVDALHPLVSLVQDPDKMHVGFVVKMNYDSVVVLTNDKWKQQCGGIPQNAFLVATAFDPDNFGTSDPTDQIVVLLRARDEASLPQDNDTLKAIIEHYQRKTEIQAPDRLDGIEKITHSRLQFKGLECNILGAFYSDTTGRLFMGSDVENFYSVARLRVYRPTAATLEKIVNFIDPIKEEKAKQDAVSLLNTYPDPIPIGNVRYTSTNKSQAAASNVPVRIQPMDFLTRRTAVFGMTRTGKSNTVKTTVASVATVAKKAGVKIGQIIFDIKGEYANANGKDDGSSLADALGGDVVRYRGMQKVGFHDLRDNMYKSLNNGLATIQNLLRADKQNSGSDMNALMGLSLHLPTLDDFDGDQDAYRSAVSRRSKKVAIYKCILRKAGLPYATDDNVLTFKISKKTYNSLHDHMTCSNSCKNESSRIACAQAEFGDPSSGISLEDGIALFIRLRNINRTNEIVSSNGKSAWFDEIERGLLNLLYGKSDNDTFIRSTRVIGDAVRQWHSPTGSDNVERDIYNFLLDGKVVIVDLSVGTEETRSGRAEVIAEHIRTKGLTALSEAKEPPIIMMYVEEAHNLIGKDAEITSTWPRIAKEGAAMNLGMVYCTQEPSSIQPNIMANTENFFVTHLNNDKEVKAIGDYYDFLDFKGLIKKAQDVGFSRIKTLSANFVVPTQILRFTPAEVKKAYDEAKPGMDGVASSPARTNA